MTQGPTLRLEAERRYAQELEWLAQWDGGARPQGWSLTPKAVRTFICGGQITQARKKHVIARKFFGDDALVERCIVTLAGTRALLLVGEPGTAKSLLSELLAAAISGVSTNVIQGSASTTEEQVAYTWNYALLLAQGPTERSLVPGPLMIGMRHGQLVRFEEITRCPAEIQDTMISVLSEKFLVVGELPKEERIVQAIAGFNVIATANLRDRGVHEMSAALKRRFNFETVQPIEDRKLELELVKREAEVELRGCGIDMTLGEDVVELLVTAFQDLRLGVTEEGTQIERPTTLMSTAEAVAVCLSAGIDAHYYGEGTVTPERLSRHLAGVVFKDRREDLDKLRHYFLTVVTQRGRSGDKQDLWSDFQRGRRHWDR